MSKIWINIDQTAWNGVYQYNKENVWNN
jgi:hypothetical protein